MERRIHRARNSKIDVDVSCTGPQQFSKRRDRRREKIQPVPDPNALQWQMREPRSHPRPHERKQARLAAGQSRRIDCAAERFAVRHVCVR